MDIHAALRLFELRRNFAPEDLKKAFRALQLRWHPDKCVHTGISPLTANKMFQELQDAHIVLKADLEDRQDRKQDSDDEAGGGIGVDEDEDEIDEEEMPRRSTRKRAKPNASDPFFDPTARRTADGPKYSPDSHVTISITFLQMYTGTSYEHCIGGKKITIRLEPGIPDGTQKIAAGMSANNRMGWIEGDLVFTVRVKPDPRYKRVCNDLHDTVTISLLQSICEEELHIDAIDGGTHVLPVPRVIRNGDQIVVAGKGFRRIGTREHGNLVVIFNVLETSLSKKQRDQIKDALS
jgi:DnaJ-class molecular chaperone